MAREMKNSGVRWIGDIPSNWSVKRLKYAADYFYKGNGITKDEVFEDGDVECVRYGEIYSKYNGTFTKTFSRTYLNAQINPRLVTKGDILFAGTGELVDEIGKNIVFMGNEPCIIGGDIIGMRHQQDPIYLNYALNSYAQIQKSKGKAKLKVVHISSTDIQNLIILLPPLSEQKVIADFLDAKCGEIDGLLADLDAEVKTLTEYKKSVIAETVTHGIHQVATKHTGISWIGDIPSSWDLKRLQFCIKEINVKNNPIQTDFVLSLTIKDGVLPYDEKGDIGNKAKENHADYKLAFPNTIVLNSMNILIGAVGISKYFGCVSPVYYVFKNQENCDLRYINYVLSSVSFQKNLRNYAKGILEIRLRVSAFDILRQKIPVPSLEEQIEIADYLDRKCLNIETAIKDKTTQIETLKAYKSSLIYEYVTGKKQVL